MTNKIHYGELVPEFFLVRKESEQLGVAYCIYHNDIDIFTFKSIPESEREYCRRESEIAKEKGLVYFCWTGWYYNARTSTANFTFTPRIGFIFYNAIVASGWNVEEINKGKKYHELDQSVYIYNLAGKLIEKNKKK